MAMLNFASKFVYVNDDADEVKEEELERTVQQGYSAEVKAPSSSAIASKRAVVTQKAALVKSKKVAMESSAPKGSMPQRPQEPYRHQVDTNVVAIKLANLAQNSDAVATGDPNFCAKCHACFNHLSGVVNREEKKEEKKEEEKKDEKKDEKKESKEEKKESKEEKKEKSSMPPSAEDVSGSGEQMWTCEFCGHKNLLDLAPEEVPKNPQIDYVLTPSPAKSGVALQASAAAAEEKKDESVVVFVIDVSGSMCVTQQVKGHFELKGKKDDLDFLSTLGNDYVRPARRQDVTYVSRLSAVQAAVDKQLETLKKSKPHQRVGIVTFNNDVTVVGDGTAAPVTITGDRLMDQKSLQEMGAKVAVNQPISKTCTGLSEKLYALQEHGQTALGPALVVAIAMCRQQRGSRVILCTDGLANVGLGAVDRVATEEDKTNIANWYEGVGNYAKLCGVTTDVISIKGDECALEHVGKVCEATGGTVDRVDPLELTQNFSSILAKPVIATHVQVTFILHKGLQFRNEDSRASSLVRDIGNITEDSEITLEYGVRGKEEMKAYKHLKSLPFQVQVKYEAMDGMKAMRVYTEAQKITTERKEAESEVQVELLQANMAQQGARLASKGLLKTARINNLANFRLLNRVAKSPMQQQQVQQFATDLDNLDVHVTEQEMDEALDEDDAKMAPSAAPSSSLSFASTAPAPRARASKPKAKTRFNDESYTMFSHFAKASSASYQSPMPQQQQQQQAPQLQHQQLLVPQQMQQQQQQQPQPQQQQRRSGGLLSLLGFGSSAASSAAASSSSAAPSSSASRGSTS